MFFDTLSRTDWGFDVFRHFVPCRLGLQLKGLYRNGYFFFSVTNVSATHNTTQPAKHTISANGLINSDVIVNSNMIFYFIVFPYSNAKGIDVLSRCCESNAVTFRFKGIESVSYTHLTLPTKRIV